MTKSETPMSFLLRRFQKPLIKRLAGTWICTGRGVTACGASPKSAYTSWQMLEFHQAQTWNQNGGSVWLVQK